MGEQADPARPCDQSWPLAGVGLSSVGVLAWIERAATASAMPGAAARVPPRRAARPGMARTGACSSDRGHTVAAGDRRSRNVSAATGGRPLILGALFIHEQIRDVCIASKTRTSPCPGKFGAHSGLVSAPQCGVDDTPGGACGASEIC